MGKRKIAWIKLPVDLMVREEVANLIHEKGMAGLGVYIATILEMYRRDGFTLTETDARLLKFEGARRKTSMSVIQDYGLFRSDGRGHLTSSLNFFDGGKAPADDDGEATECEQRVNSAFNTPARINREREKEKDYHHSDGDDGYVAKVGVKSDGDFISQIPRQSEWTEVALMRSRFGSLIARNWDVAMEAFRRHVIANCRGADIRSVDDAKRYFLYYVTNAVTGPLLRQALEEHERRYPGLNAYRYEDPGSRPGNRRYNGMPLPDDAPPRPTARSDWDYTGGEWINIEC